MSRLKPSDFVLVNRFLLEAPLDEWLAVLPDATEIVISGNAHEPSALAIRKARSVIEARKHLESQARQVLATLSPQPHAWRLLTIDLGAAAQRHPCDFLMCFASDAQSRGPYAELAFTLTSAWQDEDGYQISICSTWGTTV